MFLEAATVPSIAVSLLKKGKDEEFYLCFGCVWYFVVIFQNFLVLLKGLLGSSLLEYD